MESAEQRRGRMTGSPTRERGRVEYGESRVARPARMRIFSSVNLRVVSGDLAFYFLATENTEEELFVLCPRSPRPSAASAVPRLKNAFQNL